MRGRIHTRCVRSASRRGTPSRRRHVVGLWALVRSRLAGVLRLRSLAWVRPRCLTWTPTLTSCSSCAAAPSSSWPRRRLSSTRRRCLRGRASCWRDSWHRLAVATDRSGSGSWSSASWRGASNANAVIGQRARPGERLSGGSVASRTGFDSRTGRGCGLAVSVFPALHDACGGQAERTDPGALERLQARPAPRWRGARAPVGGGDGRRAAGSAGAADDVRDGGAHDRPLIPDDGGPARRTGARGRRRVPRDQAAARARRAGARSHRGRVRHPGAAADHRGAEPERDLPGRAVEHEVDAGSGAPAADRSPAAYRDSSRHRQHRACRSSVSRSRSQTSRSG